ncbi:MAG: type VI secretion system tube protein Hcp [Maricaulaceae bacterium]
MGIYLKHGDLKGAATLEDHEAWIDVSSFQWGVEVPTAQKGQAQVGHRVYSSFVVTKEVDSATTGLMRCAAKNVVTPETFIDFISTSGAKSPYFSLTFKKVRVLGIDYYCAGAGVVETVRCFFESYEMTYRNLSASQGAPTSRMSFQDQAPL